LDGKAMDRLLKYHLNIVIMPEFAALMLQEAIRKMYAGDPPKEYFHDGHKVGEREQASIPQGISYQGLVNCLKSLSETRHYPVMPMISLPKHEPGKVVITGTVKAQLREKQSIFRTAVIQMAERIAHECQVTHTIHEEHETLNITFSK
jgi:hypothetical protein